MPPQGMQQEKPRHMERGEPGTGDAAGRVVLVWNALAVDSTGVGRICVDHELHGVWGSLLGADRQTLAG